MADYAIHDTTLIGTSNIIRKKEGSSALIDPADYPKRINLMGMLEEKTASGSIVTFSDGADDVPLKSCEVALPASLDGYDSVDVVGAGKNLVDLSSLVDGYVNSNGTFNTNHPNGEMRSDFIPVLPNTVYYFSIVETTGTAEAWVGVGEYTDTNTSSFVRQDGYWKFTTSATTKYVVVSSRNLAQATKIQLEIGNDPTTWEAYSPITTHTVSLGRTIYGGQADIVNGIGTNSYDKGSMSSTYLSGLNSNYIGYELSTAYFGGHPSVWVRNWNYSRAKARQSGGIGCVCNYFPISMHNTTIFSTQYRIYFDVNGKNISSVADFIAFVQNLEANNESLDIVYELNDTYTTDFTFDGQEVPTRLGYNAFWSEQGDMEVVYRASGTVTPIQPTLISKSITANGTYSAEDDGVDGYDAVVVNVPSIQSIAVHSGKLNIKNGTITEDADYCYTDEIECPDGWMRMDFGETSNGDFIGLEMLDNGTHSNYWVANARFRSIDLSSYYSATKTIRLAFRKTYADVVVFIDYSHSKLYSPFTMFEMQEESASLLSMTPSEEVNENTEEVEENEQNDIEG